MPETQLLLVTAATIAFLHTVLGPDHYLVFATMSKARNWSLARTLRITAYCGLGHVLGTVLLGMIGLLIGAELASLVVIEGLRGNLAGWALLVFGLMYFSWGIRQAGRSRVHSHVHSHGDVVHAHEHNHQQEHVHIHEAVAGRSFTPWAMFVVFVLGPCEALIPLFMYPAAQKNAALVICVAAVFGCVTLATMLATVTLSTLGLNKIRLPSAERYGHAIAGGSIVLCGSAVSFFGL